MNDTIKKTKVEKFDNFLGKNVVRAIYVVLILLVIGFFRGCGYSSSVKTNKKNTAATVQKLDSLIKINPDITWMMKIQELQAEKIGLENARNMLFNEDAIDKRKLTSGDVLNDYNSKIESLDKQIKDLYEQK